MESLFQEGKFNIPTIRFNKSGILSIEGRSIPEHPLKFYQPLTDWLTSFLATSPEKVLLKVHLDYLNTHSTECMLVLFKKVDDYFISSKKDVSIVWMFDEDDEDMEVLGEDLKTFVTLPFTIEEEK
jgi:SiaC family regulatory phosphoprotein